MVTPIKHILLVTFLLPVFVYSQGITNNGATITITTGAYVHIDGDANGGFLNQTTGGFNGALDIDGTMEVEGNWTNNAIAGTVLVNTAPADGLVLLTGNTNTNMGGTRTSSFENLQINKIGAGLSVTLNSLGIDETTLGTLTLTNGVFTTNANTMIVTNTASASVTGYSANSFINGNLRRYIAGVITPYAFPMGDGVATTNYHLADMVNQNLTGVTYVNSSFALINQPAMSLTELGTIYTIAEGRWILSPDVNPISGAFDARLYKMNLPGPFNDNSFAVIQRDLVDALVTDWDCTPCGIGNPGLPANGSVGRMAVDLYALRQGMTFTTTLRNQFGIGTLPGPLPIELLSFTGNCDGDKVELDWFTSSETNNDYFTLERSQDANNFQALAIVDGAGNSNSSIHYSSIDNNPFPGVNYYRLKQTDFDGQYTYSSVISTSCGVVIPFSIVNVVNDGSHLDIYISGNEGEAFTLNVYDDNGRLISQTNDQLYGGMTEVKVVMDKVNPGIYFISLSNDSNHISKKVLWGMQSY